MAKDASGQKDFICSSCHPFSYGKPVLELTLSNFEVEKEYSRINDGILELKWSLKLSPEFEYNLLILLNKALSPQELRMLYKATQQMNTGSLVLFPQLWQCVLLFSFCFPV